jgi:hypothetical protein
MNLSNTDTESSQVKMMLATWAVDAIVDTASYPLHDLGDTRSRDLIARCRDALVRDGAFNLSGFLRPQALAHCVAQLEPLMTSEAYRHTQAHNVYFSKEDPHLLAGHEALTRLTSANHTLTCDQLNGTVIREVYEWEPLRGFLAAVFRRPLYRMGDPLARLNVMGYQAGDALNWHFDRAQFTVTLLLQAPETGGVFQYRRDLRSDTDANYEGVVRLLAGQDSDVRPLALEPGTLNVFAGRYSAHRITPVEGKRKRLIAVLSYLETSNGEFTAEDRAQFYGRAG